MAFGNGFWGYPSWVSSSFRLGESFENPNLRKLITTLDWHKDRRPGWRVETFVYRGLVEQWKQSSPEMAWLEGRLTATPRREDVDKFVIRRAADLARQGVQVRVVSNDNFREYLGQVEDFNFSEGWVRDHVVKFCFSPEGDFIPADGVGEPPAAPAPAAPPVAAAPTAPVAPAAAAPQRTALLTGRGAQHPETLSLADGLQEVRCPHRRCPLRLSIRGGRIQVTGVETPAARAKALELTPNRRSWCPTCGRPLELRTEAPKRLEARRKGCAFVAVLYGREAKHVLGALVLGHSLRRSDTAHDLLLLHTEDVLQAPGAQLLEAFWELREVGYMEANERLTARSEERFRDVFTKLRAIGCDDFEKVILLDLDLLVRDNIDELRSFKAPAALRRGHKALPCGVNVALSCYNGRGEQKYGMNLGVAVLRPCQKELEKMLEVVRSRDATHQASSGPEQDFLTRWYKDWSTLDLKYNYQLHQLAYSLNRVGPEAERVKLKLENVKVYHYSGKVKPWDFYFEDFQDFEAFLEQKLLPAYCPNDADGIEAWAF